MTFKQDLIDKIGAISSSNWTISDGRVVPELQTITHGNVGKTLEACVMYADLSGSTQIVNRVRPIVAADYKSFLHCSSKLITQKMG